jgi:hypothetical protein
MNFGEVIERLECEWDSGGFFDHVRNGNYDPNKAQDILRILNSINTDEDEMLPKRLVALLWYLPSFLTWQSERVKERSQDGLAYDKFVNEVQNSLEQILGTP